MIAGRFSDNKKQISDTLKYLKAHFVQLWVRLCGDFLFNFYHSSFSHYTVKKVHEFPVSSRDVTNQTPPGQEWGRETCEPFFYGVLITNYRHLNEFHTFPYWLKVSAETWDPSEVG